MDKKKFRDLIKDAAAGDQNAADELYKAISKGGGLGHSDGGNAYQRLGHSTRKGVDVVEGLFNGTLKILKPWMEIDRAASSFAKSVGMSVQSMKDLRRYAVDFATDAKLGILYNMSAKELVEAMGKASGKVGRNIMFGAQDRENIAAMQAVMGDRYQELFSGLDNFGLSMSDAARFAGDMFRNAAESGLNFEVYSENFTQNLKLAEQYTFRDGVRGVERMAQKATELKFSMQAASAFAEKLSSIEGAINTAAGLQVLGGPFASMADPLSLLNDSMLDIESLFDKVTSRFGELARFNRKTGEVEVSAFNRQRIKAAAEATGMSYSDLMTGIMNAGRRDEVARQIAGSGVTMDEHMRRLVMNSATFQNGIAGITDENGNFKALSKLGPEDIPHLVAINRGQAEDIKDIAKNLRSLTDIVEGTGKYQNDLQAWLTGPMGRAVKGIAEHVGVMVSVAVGGMVANATKGGGRILENIGDYKEQFDKAMERTGGSGPSGTSGRGSGTSAPAGPAPRRKKSSSGVSGIKRRARISILRHGKMAGGALGVGLTALDIVQAFGADTKEERNRELVSGGITAAGSIIGTAMGGPIGAVAGPIIGKLVGEFVSGAMKRHDERKIARAEKTKKLLELNGLKGNNYTEDELRAIRKAIDSNTVSNIASSDEHRELREKLDKNGDFDAIKRKMAYGGYVQGKSHSQGGVRNLELEGGEFVVNKEATRRFYSDLKSINSNSTPTIKPNAGISVPTINVSPSLKPVSEKPRVVKHDPVEVNVNGTIKLTGANGKSADITDDILKNPVFIKKLTALITDQMTINSKGSKLIDRA